MRRTTKARHTLGIRGQLMWFLCFICLFLLGLFWLLSTQLLEPLYTKHIETQLTNQADSIVERLDDAIAEGKVLSSWSFGQLAVNSDFFDKLTLELYTKGSLNSFCVDISDTTLHTIYKIENQSFCNLHGTYLSDSANNDKIIATALAMRRKCRSVGSFVQTLNPPRLSGSAQLLVGRITADGSYTVLVTTSLVHVTEAGKVLSTLLPLAAALIFGFAMSAAWLFSEWFTKPLRELSGSELIMMEQNAPYNRRFETLLAQHQVECEPFLRLPSASAARDLLLGGSYLSLLPWYTVRADVEAGLLKLLSVTGWDITQSVQMVLHRSKVLTPQIEGFLSELSRALADALTQPAP